jgi:hypothetical protein
MALFDLAIAQFNSRDTRTKAAFLCVFSMQLCIDIPYPTIFTIQFSFILWKCIHRVASPADLSLLVTLFKKDNLMDAQRWQQLGVEVFWCFGKSQVFFLFCCVIKYMFT